MGGIPLDGNSRLNSGSTPRCNTSLDFGVYRDVVQYYII